MPQQLSHDTKRIAAWHLTARGSNDITELESAAVFHKLINFFCAIKKKRKNFNGHHGQECQESEEV